MHIAGTAFVVGAGVMAIEITAARMLAPYFGSSMLVWTSLIVTILLGLSIGYWYGGKIASQMKDGRQVLGVILSAAAILVLFGVWVVAGFSLSVSGLLSAVSTASFVVFFGSLLVSFVVFAAPVLVLAIAGPVIVKEWTQIAGGDVGIASGRYFAVSTIGSVIGTVLPTLVFVPTFGSRATLILVALTLLITAFPFVPRKYRIPLVIVAVSAVAALVLQPRTVFKGIVYESESVYQLIRVREEDDGTKTLMGDAVTMSIHGPDGGRTMSYYDFLATVPLWRQDGGGEAHVVIIGSAGGSIGQQIRNLLPDRNISLVGVELDKEIAAVGRRFFGSDSLGMRQEIDDGRMFLRGTEERFDSIVIDTYSEMYVPPHLITREFFTLVKDHLMDGGVVGMNVIGPDRDAALLRATTNTLATVFRNVVVVPIGGASWNHAVFASDATLDPVKVADALPPGYDDVMNALRYTAYDVVFDGGVMVLTDDLAPVEFMTDSMIMAEALNFMRDR